MPKYQDNSQRGFTLIELLIVVAILGILAGIMASVIKYEEYLKQARDARRVNDILTIQTAITSASASSGIAFTDTSSCTTCDSITGTEDIDGTGWIQFTNISGLGLKDYIQLLPLDPKNEGELKYSFYSDGSKFEINAILESDKYQINAQKDGGNDLTVYERGWDLELH